MARKPQVAVEPRKDGRWAVQTDGTSRPDSLHDRKSDAVDRARELASNKKTELVIKNADGRIAQKDSHGKDIRVTDDSCPSENRQTAIFVEHRHRRSPTNELGAQHKNCANQAPMCT